MREKYLIILIKFTYSENMSEIIRLHQFIGTGKDRVIQVAIISLID